MRRRCLGGTGQPAQTSTCDFPPGGALRRPPGGDRVRGHRSPCPEYAIDSGPARHRKPGNPVRVLLAAGDGHLRLPPRLGALRSVHLPAGAHRTRRRAPHVLRPRPRHRPAIPHPPRAPSSSTPRRPRAVDSGPSGPTAAAAGLRLQLDRRHRHLHLLDRHRDRELGSCSGPGRTSRPPTSPTATTPSAYRDRRGGQLDHRDARLQRRHPAAAAVDRRRPDRPTTTPAPPSASPRRTTRRPSSARSTPAPRASARARATPATSRRDLADGAYTFRVRATDAAGNAATATREFELAAPAIRPTPPSAATTATRPIRYPPGT